MTPAPLRTAGVLLRALLGLAVLAALIAGVPYLLLAVGHQPTELADGFSLLEQDDGRLFLVVLTCLGWAGWAAFTLSAMVETFAVLRRRSAPRIKGLGGLQSIAGFLIGGIVLLAPTAASAATPAVAATATHTVGEVGTTTAPRAASAEETDWPRHTVASATELPWDLAEEYLGDGKRWKDIAALNPGIPQLVAGDQYLPTGAVIKLPADARPVAPATSPAPAASSAPQTKAPDRHDDNQQRAGDQSAGQNGGAAAAGRPDNVTVKAGDSLWTIADDHGDPEDWKEIYEANKGEPLPGGGIFTDPNLIIPGQVLDLPTTTTTQPPAKTDTSSPTPPPAPKEETDKKPAPTTPPQEAPGQDTHTDQPVPPASAPTPSRTAQLAPGTAAPPPSTTAPAPAQDTSHAPAPAAGSSDSDTTAAPAALWTGTGALAGALVATLAVRRMLQQRRRRLGRRIPMPKGRTAATEQGLRAAQHPTGFDLLDTALRSLALNLAAAGRELPIVTAVVLHDAKVELHLAQDTVPMKPFTQTAGRQDLWVCPASNPDLADDEKLAGADAPYPALVSLGWDGAGHLVLVDLEYIGVLNLTGDDEHAQGVLRAVAVELASTPLPGHLEISVLADTTPGLDTAAPERVARIDDTSAATAELTSHTGDQRRALSAIGADSLRAARLMDDAAGAWTPYILLAQDLPDTTDRTALFSALAEEPRVAGAVITAGTPAGLPATAWTLECHGSDHPVVLPGSDLPIKLQGLSEALFTDAIELLTLAASDTDVPAADRDNSPYNPDDEDEQDGPGHGTGVAGVAEPARAESEEEPDDATGPGTAEDGLPAEYAELEKTELKEDDEPQPAKDRAQQDVVSVPSTAPARHHEEDEPSSTPHAPSGPESTSDLTPKITDGGDNASTATPTTGGSGPAAGPSDVVLALAGPRAAATTHATFPTPAAKTASADDTVPAPSTQTDTETGPDVLLLGPVDIQGATGRIDSSRRSVGTELIAFLALNPGVDHHRVDEALWPGRLVNKQMRNAVISRTRSWLGKDTDGTAHLPRVQDTGDSRYRLGSAVTCDWTRFQRFARTGLTHHDEDGDLALRRALALVRGRPFTGIDTQRYAWAEPDIQEMISAIVDVAHELSTRRRETGDIPGALWAAKCGLLAAEESEMLHRQIFLAHHAAGDIDALREAAARLARINEQLLGGVDMEAETAELLRNLLPRPVTRTR
ncbi:LysM peptidoglycan-binding domain-containing protein [Streptomyces sp. NPDC090056]|uniref:LysM peptidoglycan-binding domain-containing protein n=1 Tax=Streptomyces sp. NPDC090056 TaxID=3365934 RepID=UPI003824EC94